MAVSRSRWTERHYPDPPPPPSPVIMLGSGSYNVPIGQLPYPGGAGLYAIPSDYDLFPAKGPPWGHSHSFVLPWNATLTAVRLRGDPSIVTTNTIVKPPVAPPAVRSHNIASSGIASVPSQNVVLASVLSGSSVYVAIEHDSPGPLASVTDSEGNSYTLATFQSFVNLVIEWWYRDNLTAATPLTITATGAANGHMVVEAVELTGTNTAGSLDATGGGPPNSNSDTVTPSQANDLCLLKVADLNDPGSYTATGGSTLIDSNTGDGGVTQPIAAADLSQPGGPPGVPVTISANFSGAQTPGQYGALALAVKGAPGPALAVDLDLYLNGVFFATLATVPPGATSFNVFAAPGLAIPAGAIINLVLDLSDYGSGHFDNWLVAFAVVPT